MVDVKKEYSGKTGPKVASPERFLFPWFILHMP